MGSQGSKVARTVLANKEVKVLCMGMSASGKSELLYRLSLGDMPTADIATFDPTVPRLGPVRSTYNGLNIIDVESFDYGGRGGGRYMKRFYYQQTQGIIFCVDSTDRASLADAKIEFDELMTEAALLDVPVLVMANKQHMPEAMTVTEIQSTLGLDALPKTRPWRMQAASVEKNEGVHDGLDWLSIAICGNMFKPAVQPAAETPAKVPVKEKSDAKSGGNSVQKMFRSLFGHSVAA